MPEEWSFVAAARPASPPPMTMADLGLLREVVVMVVGGCGVVEDVAKREKGRWWWWWEEGGGRGRRESEVVKVEKIIGWDDGKWILVD